MLEPFNIFALNIWIELKPLAFTLEEINNVLRVKLFRVRVVFCKLSELVNAESMESEFTFV